MGPRPVPTPSQTVGPFFRHGLAWLERPSLIDPVAPDAVVVAGAVYDGTGEPVPDAVVEIWQADRHGRFGVAGPGGWTGFGRALTDATGCFSFVTVKPGIVAAGEGPPQAPHVDVSVFARGLLQRAVTRLYFPDEDQANAADPVLASIEDPVARSTLVAEPAGDRRLRFDVHLQGDRETAFFVW